MGTGIVSRMGGDPRRNSVMMGSAEGRRDWRWVPPEWVRRGGVGGKNREEVSGIRTGTILLSVLLGSLYRSRFCSLARLLVPPRLELGGRLAMPAGPFQLNRDVSMDQDAKRRALDAGIGEGASSGSSTAHGAAELDALTERVRMMEARTRKLTETVGDNEPAQPVLGAVKREISQLNHRMGAVEHATYYAWILNMTQRGMALQLVEAMQEWTREWEKARDTARDSYEPGPDRDVGACKNYVYMGVLNAMCSEESQASAETKSLVKERTMALVSDGSGNVSAAKVRTLDRAVAHCQLTVVTKQKKAFLNMKVRETEGEVMKVLYAWLDTVGTRQLDPPPLRPSTKALRDTLTKRQGV